MVFVGVTTVKLVTVGAIGVPVAIKMEVGTSEPVSDEVVSDEMVVVFVYPVVVTLDGETVTAVVERLESEVVILVRE
jgi:hypothetical protein